MAMLWLLILGLVLPFFVGIVSQGVTVDEIESLKAQKAELGKKREQAQAELDRLESELGGLIDKKLALDAELVAINDEIEATEALIAAYRDEIEKKSAELADTELRRDELYEVFKQRLRVMYEDGQTSYIALLLQSGSLGELLDRADAIELIVAKDRKTVNELNELAGTQKVLLAELEAAKAAADAELVSLEAAKADIISNRDRADAVMMEFEEKKSENLADVEKFLALEEAADAEIAASIAAYNKEQEEKKKAEEEAKKKAEEEAKRKAEEEAKKKAEEEAKKKAEEEAAKKKAEEEAKKKAEEEAIAAEKFTWPVPGFKWITDDYGYRTHPITGKVSFHAGIDVGVYLGEPIYATAAGKVISNTYNSAYGYMIKIDHGDGWVSLYAHFCRKSSLAVGTVVKKGQVVGYCGSTGLSTGPHLHFGLYKDGASVNPLDHMTRR